VVGLGYARVSTHMSCTCAGQEEHDQQHERQVPRMHGMGDGRDERGEDAARGQGLLRVGTVDQQADGRDGDDSPHRCKLGTCNLDR